MDNFFNNRYHSSNLMTKVINVKTYKNDLYDFFKQCDLDFITDKSMKSELFNNEYVTGFEHWLKKIELEFENNNLPMKNLVPLAIETVTNACFFEWRDYYETYERVTTKVNDEIYVLSVAVTEKTKADRERDKLNK